jgi:hypothetical protein
MGTVIKIIVLGVLIVAILSLVTPIFTPILTFIQNAVNSDMIDMANGFYDALPSDLKNLIVLGLSVMAVGLGLDLVTRK